MGRFHSVYTLFVLLLPLVVGDSSLQSIYSADEYLALKPCAAGCIYYPGSDSCWHHDKIGAAVGCDKECNIAKNDCYCRADLIPVANSYITACVKEACTIGNYQIDLTSAANLYNGYCNKLGSFPATITTVQVTPLVVGPASAVVVTATVTGVTPTNVVTQTLYVSTKTSGNSCAMSHVVAHSCGLLFI
ncbi:hypothetical protein B0O99DRAFT_695035 [Bisporella sp. PMI_857]|nr:hypothetical protein B0O99DRAFT_695035 [Bisporella sp. PMI_857]